MAKSFCFIRYFHVNYVKSLKGKSNSTNNHIYDGKILATTAASFYCKVPKVALMVHYTLHNWIILINT